MLLHSLLLCNLGQSCISAILAESWKSWRSLLRGRKLHWKWTAIADACYQVNRNQICSNFGFWNFKTLYFRFHFSNMPINRRNYVSPSSRHFSKVPINTRNCVSPISRHFSKVPIKRRNYVSPISRHFSAEPSAVGARRGVGSVPVISVPSRRSH